MTEFLKIVNVILLASVKFFWTTPYALFLGYNAWEAFFMIMVGGTLGSVFFYYFGALLQYEWYKHHHYVEKFLPVLINAHIEKKILDSKLFQSKRIRKLINLRERFGLWGMALLTPVVLSIPLGSMLMSRFFGKHHFALGKLILCVFIWGLISIFVFYLLPELKTTFGF